MTDRAAQAYAKLSAEDKESVNAVIAERMRASDDPLLQSIRRKFLQGLLTDPAYSQAETRAAEMFIETQREMLATNREVLANGRAFKQRHPSIHPHAETAANDFLVTLDGNQFTPAATPPGNASDAVRKR